MIRRAGLRKTKEVEARRARVVAICRSFPDVDVSGDEHLAFKVRKRIFGYYLFDHHGDGRVALNCKAAPGDLGRLVEKDPAVFFVPCYVGARGWVGMRLDRPRVNWAEVAYLLRTAYRLTAPRTLVARLESGE